MRGLVTRSTGNSLEVQIAEGRLRCSLRGRLKKERLPVGKLVTIGDEVDVRNVGSGEGTIEKVLPRRSKLSRPDPIHPNRELIIAANIDLLIIVMAVADPDPDLLTIDKCSVMARAGGCTAVLCMNKTDLGSPPWLHMYGKAGIPVVRTSAVQGDGLNDLRAHLSRRTSVFLGPSGVGKSTLLNALQPGLALKTREVSGKTGEGRHTTTWAEVVEVGDARVIDTPGLEFFGLWGVLPETLGEHFPDFPLGCKFRDCQHTNEPRCAVRQGVERGDLSASRYESYLRIRQILKEQREFFGAGPAR